LHQEKTLFEQKIFSPKNSTLFYLSQDQISPQTTGILNKLIWRHQSSLVDEKEISNTKLTENYNFTNITLDIPAINYKENIQKSLGKQEIREVTSPSRSRDDNLMAIGSIIEKYTNVI
jgi:hypothetical protein